ncbi:hypothetical protein GCM10029992_23910 [Glycomyces albus]
MPQFIDAGNGETIIVVQDGSADGYTMYSSVDGRLVIADEDALADLGLKMSDIEELLAGTRDLVTNGNLTVVRGAEYAQMPDYQIAQVDALNLKLGTFPDAEEVRDLYRENFYMAKAEQIERIAHGYSTGRQVAEDIGTEYVNNDGDVAASVEQLGNEFTESDGISEDDVAEAQAENEGADTETETPEGEEETTPRT